MVYLDTSVLGALFFREPGAQEIAERLARVRRPLRVSAWTVTEMASVAVIKQRTSAIDGAGRRAALAAFGQFTRDSLQLSEVEPADFAAAVEPVDPRAACRRRLAPGRGAAGGGRFGNARYAPGRCGAPPSNRLVRAGLSTDARPS